MEKIKPTINKWIQSEGGKDILTVLIVILVGLGSFGLGRLSKESSFSGIKVEYPAGQASAISAVNSFSSTSGLPAEVSAKSGNYFASKRGHKYYPVGCSAGNTIKTENRIYFATEADAIKAGYEKSASCK